MDLRLEIVIDAPAARVWEAVGERFMHIGDWAAPITSSCPIGDRPPEIGAVRACTIAPVGPVKAGLVKERLTHFDRERMTFEYEALEGMPSFMIRAVNRWSVVPRGEQRSVVQVHATLAIRGPAVLASCLFKWQFQRVGARVNEELKYFVEHGEPHPRKAAALPSRRRV